MNDRGTNPRPVGCRKLSGTDRSRDYPTRQPPGIVRGTGVALSPSPQNPPRRRDISPSAWATRAGPLLTDEIEASCAGCPLAMQHLQHLQAAPTFPDISE